jgi:hypothetical protein
MYKTWGKKVFNQLVDSRGIFSRACASLPTFYNYPKAISTLNSYSPTNQLHLLVRFVEFPIS